MFERRARVCTHCGRWCYEFFSKKTHRVCEAVPWAVWPLTLELWWIMPESKPRPISKVNFGSNSLNKSITKVIADSWFRYFRWAPVWWFLSRIVNRNPQGALVHLQRAHAHWKQRERRGASNEEATGGHGRIRKKQDEPKYAKIKAYSFLFSYWF